VARDELPLDPAGLPGEQCPHPGRPGQDEGVQGDRESHFLGRDAITVREPSPTMPTPHPIRLT
jgi:hypothetical protein